VIYTSSSKSLATLELLVHFGTARPHADYKVMVIQIPDKEKLIKKISLCDLPENWRTLAAYSKLQKIGSKWIEKKETLVLEVPSVVIPKEKNLLINTKHSDFKKQVLLKSVEEYFWDGRLF
jgi:RES domain-containing protein